MNHYPHHIGDFNNATRHLTRVERSLYRDMLELYYDTEQPLNCDTSKIARRVLASTDAELEALNSVLDEFFVLQDDGWHNIRCDVEIAKYQGQIEQASRAGKASAAKRYGKNLTAVEQPFNQPEPEPEPEPIGAKAPLPSAVPDCPHEILIDLFEKQLPNLAQPKKSLWRAGKNAPAMKARWRWVMTATHEKGERTGQRLATTKDEAIAWFERYFAYVARSEFLTGSSSDWACDLGWLVNAANFEKVLAGNYENKLKAVA